MKKVLFFFTIGLFSCQCTTKTGEESFKKGIVEIKGKSFLKDYFEIKKIYVVDSLLVTRNNRGSKKLFSVFNRKGKLLMKFGQVGQGPNDFESYTKYNNQWFHNDAGDVCIWLYERNHHRLRMVNLSKTVQSKNVNIEKEVNIPPYLNLISPYYVNFTLIVGNISNLDTQMDKVRFFNPILNKVEKKLTLLPKVKRETRDITKIQYDYNSLFVNQLCYHPSRGFVDATQAINRLDFISLDGEVTKTILGSDIDDDELYNLSHFPKRFERMVYYYTMTTTDKYVFTVYNGVDKLKNINRKNHIIRVFDWEGIEKLRLKPVEPLRTVAFDEVNSILYGVDENYDVFKYDLKNVFTKI